MGPSDERSRPGFADPSCWRAMGKALWRRLSEPHPGLPTAAERRQARLVASLLAALLFLVPLSVFLGSILHVVPGDRPRIPWTVIAPYLAILLPLYASSRTQFHRVAAALMVLITHFASWMLIWLDPANAAAVDSLVLAPLLSILVLRRRATLILVFATILEVLIAARYIGALRPISAQEIGFIVVITGALIVVAGVYYDNLKQIEGHAATLEETVAARTAQLERALERAEAANRARNTFLSTMSHELRTPLNAIIGSAAVLQDQVFGELNSKQIRYIRNILAGGRRLSEAVTNILDLAQFEAGDARLEMSQFHVAAVLAELGDTVAERARQKQITLTVDVAPDLPALTSNRRMFRQILYNLVDNGIKFTPPGGSVQVIVDSWDELGGEEAERSRPHPPTPASRPAIRVRVVDTGIGLKPDDQRLIFDAFTQADMSYARRQEGMGIGLALARRFVELHGGRIWVESAGEQAGSTFVLVIPTEG